MKGTAERVNQEKGDQTRGPFRSALIDIDAWYFEPGSISIRFNLAERELGLLLVD